MSISDKNKWNQKYKSNPKMPTNIIDIVKEYAPLAKGKDALDIACGMGRHSIYLASLGFRVEALDISPIALKSLNEIENITTKEVDFDNYQLQKDRYDLIVCVNFLNRKLFPQIFNALKSGGLFIFESFIYHPNNTKAPSNRSFLLEQGELEATVAKEYKTLHIKEFWDRGVLGDKLFKGSFVGYKL